jgi:hypothetical protein
MMISTTEEVVYVIMVAMVAMGTIGGTRYNDKKL